MNSTLSHSGFKLVKRECAFRPSFCCGLILARLLGSRLCEAFLQRPDHINYSATVRSDSDMRGAKPSELHVSPMLDGWHRIDGEFDLEDSAEYLAELETRYEEIYQADHSEHASEEERNRTRSQRYAAAQIEMARRSS